MRLHQQQLITAPGRIPLSKLKMILRREVYTKLRNLGTIF